MMVCNAFTWSSKTFTFAVVANSEISSFMSLSFVHGWCENPMVNRSGKGTNTQKA